MNRRESFQRTTMSSLVGAIPFAFPPTGKAHPAPILDNSGSNEPVGAILLKAPDGDSIPVAFVISEGAVIMDVCGPWQVFEGVEVSGRKADTFHLYTVADTKNPVCASGGIRIFPDYTFETAPKPKVIVVPAQNGSTAAMLDWIRNSMRSADVTMSVCTGTFILTHTGLLSGKAADTPHNSYESFALQFPEIRVEHGARFVEVGNVAIAGGLSSGIDLALHMVKRYLGRETASKTDCQMEYGGQS